MYKLKWVFIWSNVAPHAVVTYTQPPARQRCSTCRTTSLKCSDMYLLTRATFTDAAREPGRARHARHIYERPCTLPSPALHWAPLNACARQCTATQQNGACCSQALRTRLLAEPDQGRPWEVPLEVPLEVPAPGAAEALRCTAMLLGLSSLVIPQSVTAVGPYLTRPRQMAAAAYPSFIGTLSTSTDTDRTHLLPGQPRTRGTHILPTAAADWIAGVE